MCKLFPLFAFFASIFACGQADLIEMISVIESETGLAVENKTFDHDSCVVEQLRHVGLEFKAMESTEQQSLLAKVKSDFDKVIIEKSQVTLKKTGKLVSLVHFDMVCSHDDCWYEEVERKVISDERQNEGSREPNIITAANRVLTLQVYSELSAYESIEMMTTKSGLYEKIESINDHIYQDALAKKAVYHRRTRVMNDLTCRNATNLLKSLTL